MLKTERAFQQIPAWIQCRTGNISKVHLDAFFLHLTMGMAKIAVSSVQEGLAEAVTIRSCELARDSLSWESYTLHVSWGKPNSFCFEYHLLKSTCSGFSGLFGMILQTEYFFLKMYFSKLALYSFSLYPSSFDYLVNKYLFWAVSCAGLCSRSLRFFPLQTPQLYLQQWQEAWL